MKKQILFIALFCITLSTGYTKPETKTEMPQHETIAAAENHNTVRAQLADETSLEKNLQQITEYIRCYKKPEQRDQSIAQLSDIIHNYGYEMSIEEFDIYPLDLDTLARIWNVNKARDLNPMNADKLGTGKNLIVKHPGNEHGNKTLFLTAHYDTTINTSGVIDNGTGVAVVLELMEKLVDYNGSLNLVFVLFDCEETGQQGSRTFMRNRYPLNEDEVLGCINIDMVGEMDAGDIVMKFGSGEHNILSLMWEHQTENEIEIQPGTLTDELAFNYSKVPAITLENKTPDFSLDKENREKQLEQIDYTQIAGITNDILQFITKFDFKFYNSLLTKKSIIDSVLPSSQVLQIESCEYLTKTASIIDNGYVCETVLDYRMESGKEISISLIPGGYFDSDHADDYETYIFPVGENDKYHNGIIENGHLLYQKINLKDNSFDIKYYNGQYTGYIKGLNDSIFDQVLDAFQNSVLNSLYYD